MRPLEPVAVIAHEQVPYPADPTITLVFGGEVDLDEVPYTSLTEQLLAGVDAYQQAGCGDGQPQQLIGHRCHHSG
jgi:hypothetical protein